MKLSLKLFATSVFGAVLLNLPSKDSPSLFASATPLPDDQQLAQQDANLWFGLNYDENTLQQIKNIDEATQLSETSQENIDDLDEKGKAKAARDAWKEQVDKKNVPCDLQKKAEQIYDYYKDIESGSQQRKIFTEKRGDGDFSTLGSKKPDFDVYEQGRSGLLDELINFIKNSSPNYRLKM